MKSLRPMINVMAILAGFLASGVAYAATSSYAFIYAPILTDLGLSVVDPVASDFKSLMDSRGYATDLVSMSDVSATDFSSYRKILIGDNTGYLNVWGSGTAAQGIALASTVTSFNKPLIGIGEGGYAFFGTFGSKSGWPNGWHDPLTSWVATDPSHPVFNLPNPITLDAANMIQVFNNPSNEVGIYAPTFPAGFNGLGRESTDLNHYGLTLQNDRDFLWGFSGGPSDMTAGGKDLFINVVAYPVPEPETYAMMLAGLGLLGLAARRRRTKSQ